MVCGYGHENQEIELGHPRMDKLLQNRKDEEEPYDNRRTSKNKDANRHLETVEEIPKEILGS